MATVRISENVSKKFPLKNKIPVAKAKKLTAGKAVRRRPFTRITNGVRGTKRRHDSDNTKEVCRIKDDSPLDLDCLKLEEKRNEAEAATEEHATQDVLSAVDYAEDIWKHLYVVEASYEWPKANYMLKQKHVTDEMRSILVDWLVSVAGNYNIGEQTIHLSVNYIDRFLSYMSVVRDKFQLLGATALYLAIKVEEVNLMHSSEFIYLTGNAYTSEQIVRMEKLLLKVLKFDVNPPTMINFIQQLCFTHKLDKKSLYTAMYIGELTLLEGGAYLQHLPSKLAAACVIFARRVLKKKDPWMLGLESVTGYTYQQLNPVVAQQYQTFRDSLTKELQTIQNKYRTKKYHKVGALKPCDLKLDVEV